MRHHEHLPPPDHEPDWGDPEKFGELGYQLPLIADVYASGYEFSRIAETRGDQSLNPYGDTPNEIASLPEYFTSRAVNETAEFYFRSPREGHRVFAGELLACKQAGAMRRIEAHTDSPHEWFDPEVETALWVRAFARETSAQAIREHLDSLDVVLQLDQNMYEIMLQGAQTTPEIVERLAPMLYARYVQALTRWTEIDQTR